jgi:hypothetical protein
MLPDLTANRKYQRQPVMLDVLTDATKIVLGFAQSVQKHTLKQTTAAAFHIPSHLLVTVVHSFVFTWSVTDSDVRKILNK